MKCGIFKVFTIVVSLWLKNRFGQMYDRLCTMKGKVGREQRFFRFSVLLYFAIFSACWPWSSFLVLLTASTIFIVYFIWFELLKKEKSLVTEYLKLLTLVSSTTAWRRILPMKRSSKSSTQVSLKSFCSFCTPWNFQRWRRISDGSVCDLIKYQTQDQHQDENPEIQTSKNLSIASAAWKFLNSWWILQPLSQQEKNLKIWIKVMMMMAITMTNKFRSIFVTEPWFKNPPVNILSF